MKTKLTIFIGIGVLAFSVAFGFINFYTLPETSAKEFADNFSMSAADMSGTYNFDKNHSTIGFRVKHMGLVEVPGYFRDFTGVIKYDAKDVAKSSVEFSAKTTSVDTGVAPRDNHLRSKDFFEVETYPELKFKSTRIEKKGNEWMVTGDLTIKDVTKQVAFAFNIAGFVEQQGGGAKMGVTAETTINRRDYNVNYGGNMPNGVATLSDNVKVTLQIEAAMEKKEATMDKK